MRRLGSTMHVGVGTHLGALSVFPVWCDAPVAAPYLTHRDADTAIEFHELDPPVVPSLEVNNSHPIPVLVIEGETVAGGRQARVLAASVLTPPRSRIKVPVACVEQGRWGTTTRAARAGLAPPQVRSHATGSRADLEGGVRRSDQAGVWSEVDRLRRSHGAAAPTGSLHDVRDHAERAGSVAGRIPPPLDGQRGFIVGISGQVRSLDLFDRASTLQHYWADYIAAASIEARTGRPGRTSGHDARRFALRVAMLALHEGGSVGMGAQLRGSAPGVAVRALCVGEAYVHLSAFTGGAA